ncbi:MAG: oligosaccharide flippase family protein [Candidatus Binatia bacterium]
MPTKLAPEDPLATSLEPSDSERKAKTPAAQGHPMTDGGGSQVESEVSTDDLTGRNRMLRNLLASWSGHAVFVVAGFVLPRVLDRQISQTGLGIWDFGWSIVGYFGIAQLGIGASVDRYVAHYRTRRDFERMNGAVSSAACVQVMGGLVAFVLSVVVANLLPTLFATRLGDHGHEAQWMVLFLGTGVAVQLACNSFTGVMNGCHRWDLHNAINAGFHGLTIVAMLVGLFAGGGLRYLAVVSFAGTVLTEIVRGFVTYHVCPELSIRWRYVNRPQMAELFIFGGKVVLGSISGLLIQQTTGLFIVGALGAGALALYSRPMALIRHASTFVEKFASILTPTVSSMQHVGHKHELREFVLQTMQYSAYLTLPPVLLLVIMGGPILHIWMGPHYSEGALLAVLALGHLITISYAPLWTVLRGVDKHGRPALARLLAAVVTVGLNLLALHVFHCGLMGAALAVTIPLTLLDGIYLPLYACRQFALPFAHFLRRTWYQPLRCTIGFALCLTLARLYFYNQPVSALLVGLVGGGAVLAFTYWRRVLPLSVREPVKQWFAKTARQPATLLQKSGGS